MPQETSGYKSWPKSNDDYAKLCGTGTTPFCLGEQHEEALTRYRHLVGRWYRRGTNTAPWTRGWKAPRRPRAWTKLRSAQAGSPPTYANASANYPDRDQLCSGRDESRRAPRVSRTRAKTNGVITPASVGYAQPACPVARDGPDDVTQRCRAVDDFPFRL